MHDATPILPNTAATIASHVPKPVARPASRPLPDVALDRLMADARAHRARHLGPGFLIWPLAILAALVLIACLA
jgi:hypothetical protein